MKSLAHFIFVMMNQDLDMSVIQVECDKFLLNSGITVDDRFYERINRKDLTEEIIIQILNEYT